MNDPSLRYAKSHEWARLEGDVCTVGITQFAADQLTDVTYVKLTDVGKTLAADAECGELESVKTVAPVYTPVAGVVASRSCSTPTRSAPAGW
jgi:glycine cleavage system H protein